MSEVTCYKKQAKSPLSKSQKTFDRLKKKIETLQATLQRYQEELEQSMVFYHGQVQPQRAALINIFKEFVKGIYPYYKGKFRFSKRQRDILKDLMLEKVDSIFQAMSFNNIDPEICAIFEDLTGLSYKKVAANELNSFKESMQEMFSEEGMDVNLDDIELTDSEQEMGRKIAEAVNAAQAAMEEEEEEPPTKPKSQAELQKEAKAQELEALQKKGLGSIYKRLAKEIHPDLEQAPEQKAEKEEWMKRLTCAYENKDLYTLLSLEIEWMNRSENGKKIESEEQLKVYNLILKDQIKALEESIKITVFDPRYIPIHSYFADDIDTGKFILKMVYNSLQAEERELRSIINMLKSPNGEKTVRKLIQECSDEYDDYY